MREIQLGDLLEAVIDHRGKTPKKLGGDFVNTGIPVVSAIHIKGGRIEWDQRARFVTPEMFARWMPVRLAQGDVLLTSEAPLGETALVPPNCDLVLSQRLFALRGRKGELDSAYLRYFLASSTGQERLQARATGTTVTGIRQAELMKIMVPVPPFEQQRRIAGVLSTIDSMIDVDRTLADSCAALRRVLTSEALRSAKVTSPLSAVATFINGRNFTKQANGNGLPIIRTPEVRSGPTEGTMRSDTLAPRDHVAQAGDILFVWSGSLLVGRWIYEDGLVNQHIFKVVPNRDVPDWLVFGMIEHQLPYFVDVAADKATTMGHIQRSHLDEPVPFLSESDVLALDAWVRPLWDQELALRQEELRLVRARDELLPLLLSERVSVRGGMSP